MIGRGNHTNATRAAALIALVSGVLLLVGVLTPLASLLVASGGAGIALSWLPASLSNVFDARLSAMFVAIIAAALVFLGPGAFSLDSRLFGRREIIIPPLSHSPKL